MGTSPITLGVGNGAPRRLLLLTSAQGIAPPAQNQPPRTREAKFVICDQTIEGALAELKTHLRGARVVLRSKTPALVRQEFWGLLLAHFAVRGLMHEAALRADEDPDRLSFVHAVRVVRRKLPQFAALSPSGQTQPA
jgi:hypothetical protein